MRLFVGNIPWNTAEQSLREHFEPFGQVTQIKIILDHNGLPSFGLVTFAKGVDWQAAIARLNGQVFDGRCLTVALAHRQQ